MRLKGEKKTIAMIGVVVVLALLVSVGIFWVLKDTKKASNIAAPPKVDQQKQTEQQTTGDPDLKSVLEQDKANLSKEGTYAGTVNKDKGEDLNAKKKGKAGTAALESNLTQPSGALNEIPSGAPTVAGNPSVAQMQSQLGSGNTSEDAKKKTIWAMVYGDNDRQKSAGGFIEDGKKPAAAASQSAATTASKQAPVEFFKKYTAKVDFIISSETKVSSAMPFVATITQRGNIHNWKVVGKASPDLGAMRFTVAIDYLADTKGNKYTAKGFAMMSDESPGIISAVKRNDLKAIQVLGGLAALEKGTAALSQDETTYTTGLASDTVAQKKSSNRSKEAAVAGVSTAFGEAKNILGKNVDQNPALILEKNTPILIYFTMQ